MTVPSTVILWVHPRSCSTMFEQSILQRPKEFRVLHEPMGDAWYFCQSEKVSNRFSKDKCAEAYPQFKDSTFKKTWENIVTPTQPSRTFSKDMAQYIFNQPSNPSLTSVPSYGPTGNPSLIPTDALLDPSIVHTFLIRTPAKAIPSYHRLCYPGAPTDFEHFDPEEAGYREIRLLFDFLRQNGRDPLILDAEDLLANPSETMKIWCDAVQVEFDPAMLEWKEGTREHFAKWPGWHDSAQNSTGVGKGLQEKHITPANHSRQGSEAANKPEHPEIVKKCIRDNMADYEYLKAFVKRPDVAKA